MAVDSWLSRVGLDRTIIGRDPGVGCRSAAGHWQSSHCHSCRGISPSRTPTVAFPASPR